MEQVKLETVKNLLEQQEWGLCASQAAKALSESEKHGPERAFLNYALGRSLYRLGRLTEALDPSRVAVFLSEELKDYALLGEALLNLGIVQAKLVGQEESAVETQRKFFHHFEMYPKPIKDRYLQAQFNLGVYLRASGEYEEALLQFKHTFTEAKQRGDPRAAEIAQLSLRSAVWEALRLEKIEVAESLMRQDIESTDSDPLMEASRLIDQAQLAILKKDFPAAVGDAYHACILSSGSPDLMSLSLEVLGRAADLAGDTEAALVVALHAKRIAEKAERHDIVSQARSLARNLVIRHPEIVESIVGMVDGRQNHSRGSSQ